MITGASATSRIGSMLTDAVCTYTQRVAATGHSWTVLQQVPTEYDEAGNLVTQGYIIYECGTCAEQYKDESGTGPPNSDTDTDSGGLFDTLGELLGNVINSILGGVITLLETVLGQISNIVAMAGEMFGQIPEWFSGFTGFLGAIFSFLPEEFITILTFGLMALVVVAIIKRFIG